MTRPRVGFVIQRYGEQVLGGAESFCRAIARRLSPHWEIEVLTTCAVDPTTWANALPAGTDTVDDVAVWRFEVDRPRNSRRFNRQCRRVVERFHTLQDERKWMDLQGPHSGALLTHLDEHADDYDGFLLFNYLYATTYESLQRVGRRFYLVPFAHEEPWIYLRLFEDVFRSPRGIVFCTDEEREVVQKRFPFSIPPFSVIGMGIDPPKEADSRETENGKSRRDACAARFREKFDIREPFILYAGRIDESKGCHELLENFVAYRKDSNGTAGALSLVLCGSSQLTIPKRNDIHYLGFVDERDKWDALAAARLLVLPSYFESFSIVLLEAWAMETPVLVNGRCAVAVGQCRRSGGGLWYTNRHEFCAATDWLAGNESLCARLGRSGRAFVDEHYRWPRIVERYLEFVRFE